MSEPALPEFPKLSTADLAQTAAMLAAASCAMLQTDNHDYALKTAQRMFLKQCLFLQEGRWPEKSPGLSDDMDLT